MASMAAEAKGFEIVRVGSGRPLAGVLQPAGFLLGHHFAFGCGVVMAACLMQPMWLPSPSPVHA